MDSPYRSSARAQTAEAPRDTGIVGDIIEQFADRFAFYRELVQNSIDAGTDSIEVEIRHDQADQVVRASVRDSGCGMDRDVLENRLLVLFRSTKEGDDDKIGKFGIGFASALAMQPQLIRVDTVKGGTRHVLHLYPDLSYELFEAGRAQKPGTIVELEIPLLEQEYDDFVASSRAALTRWCRHASVPVWFTATDGPGERIDRALDLEGALCQVETGESDRTRVIVGLLPQGTAYAGFFNHGLMLYETDEPLIGRFGFKVQDSHLGHTLSRDNVRRDHHFRRAVAIAKELSQNALPKAIAARLREAARASREEYPALLEAILASGTRLRREDWVFPVEAGGEATTVDAKTFRASGAWTTRDSSEVATALSRRGTPVINLQSICPGAPGYAENQLVFIGGHMLRSTSELTLVKRVATSGADTLLIDKVRELLDAVARVPRDVSLRELDGASAGALSIAADADDDLTGAVATDGAWLIRVETATSNPFARFRRRSLVLNTAHPAVARAQDRAAEEPAVAASLLTRALLLERDMLSKQRSEELVELGLRSLYGDQR